MHWLASNYQWLVAVVVMPILLLLLKQWADSRKKAPTPAPEPQTARDHQKDTAALNAQGSKVTNSPVASGSNISQNINSPTLNLSLPARTTDEDKSSWPDVILECRWPSILTEPKIAGSHTVRRRPWILRNGGPGAVYDVRIRDIDFGDYQAKFPYPVRTLIDTADVHPIICRKLEGQPHKAEVVSTHDLESLIRNPPSGCDVWRYAVETYGVEEAEDDKDEEIGSDDSLAEVEIPVMISYDDKNGTRFKITYLLHYESCIEKGEMTRISGIEKVVLK